MCVVRRSNKSFGDRCFAAAGPRLWNTLPVHLRQCDSLGQFKRLLKTHLLGVFGTVALCDALVRSAVQKSSYLLIYSVNSAFNRLCQYVSSPGNRTYCYTELGVSFLAMTVTTASTHCAYPQGDGQAELTWVVDEIPRTRLELANSHPSRYYPGPT